MQFSIDLLTLIYFNICHLSVGIENLYIVGNGFDLHHNVHSRYSDFHKWWQEHTMSSYMYEDEIESYFHCDDLWSSFEENLAKFDYEKFSKDVAVGNRPNMASNHPEASLEDARIEVEMQLEQWWADIKFGLVKWLAQLNPPNPHNIIQILAENSYFLTFNYTFTLEYLYGISPGKVLHIHGRVGDSVANIYLGHDGKLMPRNESQFDDYIDEYGQIDYLKVPDANEGISERQAIDSGMAQVKLWEKPVKQIISKHESWWLSLGSVRRIFVYGLGFSSVDMPYLNSIMSSVPKTATWTVSYYSSKERAKIMQKLQSLEIQNYSFVRLQDLQVQF